MTFCFILNDHDTVVRDMSGDITNKEMNVKYFTTEKLPNLTPVFDLFHQNKILTIN